MIQQRMSSLKLFAVHANLNLCAVQTSDQRAVQTSASARCMMHANLKSALCKLQLVRGLSVSRRDQPGHLRYPNSCVGQERSPLSFHKYLAGFSAAVCNDIYVLNFYMFTLLVHIKPTNTNFKLDTRTQ